MISGVLVQPQAAADAEEIFAYLAKQDLALARRFIEAVADTVIAVRDNPNLGIGWLARDGRLTGLRWKRVISFKNHLLFYLSKNEGIVVVRILHGARDLDAILGG